ncbi:SRPBCC family protein [Demequina aestuarii]|uniref:SRPBCC family protein n=1 Tax=Demequina aestuarii TaxID=327095 RepID=UPI0007839031|nr:SRPBCC family protein [Demequina aestuarii]
MAVSTVLAQREINAQPREVWNVITDIDGAADVLSGVIAIDRLEGQGYEVGVRWRETRRMFGKEASEEMWVAAVDAPRSTTIEAESSGTRYSTVFTCEPRGLGTLLSVAFTGETVNPSFGQRMAWALFGAMGRKASEKALTQDLEDIGRAAEGLGRP